jgi:hypothetical protein
VNLHELAPRRDTVVGAEAVSQRARSRAIQACPFAHGGSLAVSPDEPTESHRLAVDERSAVVSGGRICKTVGGVKPDTAVPHQSRTDLFRAIRQQPVQVGATDSNACSAGKVRVDVVHRVLEPNPAKEMAIRFVKADAKLGQRLARIGHQAFATRFVDGVGAGFDDGAIDTALAKGDGGGKTGGTTANDQDISCRGGGYTFVRHFDHFTWGIVQDDNLPFSLDGQMPR